MRVEQQAKAIEHAGPARLDTGRMFSRHVAVRYRKLRGLRRPRRRNLDELREMAADPARARQFLLRTSMIASQRRVAAMTLTEA